MVRAPLGGLYVVFASFSTTSCTPIANAHNSLMLDPPVIAPLFLGVVSEQNTLRWCYNGLQRDMLPLPAFLSGFSFAVQAVAEAPTPSGAQWAWATAIAIDVT
jgi:hypothetical protein